MDNERVRLARIELAKRELARRQSTQQATSQPETKSPDSISNLWGSSPELRQAIQSDSPIWNSLQVPSQMASRGLSTMAGAIPEPEPTTSATLNFLKGTPGVLANTMAEAAPGFVSRASLLTAAAVPAVKALAPVGRGIANAAERWSGLAKKTPGILTEAANDASLIFSKGKDAASEIYQTGKTGSKIAGQLKNIPLKEDFLDVATKLAESGKLPPESAHEARKIIDALVSKGGGKYTMDYLRNARRTFDSIAKSSEGIAAGDLAFSRGLKADALRGLFPVNAGGTVSPFKTATALGAASFLGPVGKAAIATLSSPILQGGIATGVGLASRNITPALAVTMRQAMEEYLKRRSSGMIDKFTEKESQ